MSRTVLFLPQNDSHAETTALLADALTSRGMASIALDLNGLYHQDTSRHLTRLESRSSGLESVRPFYRLSPIRQARIVAAAIPRVRRWLEGIDAVVAFNDGAIQRLVLAEALRSGIATDLVLDGMITYVDEPQTPRTIVRQALRSAGRRLSGTTIGAFLPSTVGHALVDRTHVAGQHSLEVLRAGGSRSRRLLASGLPRWPDPATPESLPPVRHVLYLTGAFRWHGDHATADAQERDVMELAAACHEASLSLTIRVHPRDDLEPYGRVQAAVIDPRSESMTASIGRADLVLAIVSTGLIEACILGRPSRVLAIHPRWSRFERAFVADPIFQAIRDATQLRSGLAQMAQGIDSSLIEAQRGGLQRYVAATGRRAAQRIAREVGTSVAASGARELTPRSDQDRD